MMLTRLLHHVCVPAGERVVSELAPELLPWLQGMESPANFIPVTNEILAEVARRGVSRDRLLTQLHQLGAELPTPVVQLLQWAKQQQMPVKVLSDCNSVFINNILTGARLSNCIDEVITNSAGFERVQGAGSGDAAVGLGSSSNSSSIMTGSNSSSFKLVIQPRQPHSHNCPLCPSNLCKGREMSQLLQQQRKAAAGGGGGKAAPACSRGRVVYAGDGANDICPALALGADDVVLARAGHALANYVVAAQADRSLQQPAASVYEWHTHEELAQLVMQHALPSGKCSA
jgi:2-hydroxy-3-keto-5-methylthiopentenyl-1-phosphate phosphatase